MTFSNINKKFALGLLLTSSLFLQGCGDMFKEKGEALDNATTFSQGQPFYVDTVSVSAKGLSSKPDESGNINKKQFQFTACLATVTGGNLASALRNFEITDGVNKLNSIVDGSGCILWTEEIEFDFYGKIGYYWMERWVVGKDGMAGKFKTRFKFNPWEDEVLYSAFREVPTPDGSVAEEMPGTNGFSTKIVNNPNDLAGQTTVGLDAINLSLPRHADDFYEVDENLNLTIAHKYRVTFNPSILRRSFSDLYEELKAKQGKVRAVIMFFRDNKANPNLQDYDNYITTLEHDFTINRNIGTIKEDVIFKWPDISSLTTRLRVLVKIQPLVGSASVRAAYFEGNIQALPGNDIDLMNTRYNVDLINTKFKEIEARAKAVAKKPFENFLSVTKARMPLYILNDADLNCNPKELFATERRECEDSKKLNYKNYLSFLVSSSAAPRNPTTSRDYKDILPPIRSSFIRKVGLKPSEVEHNSKVYVATFVEKILQKNPTLLPVSVSSKFSTGMNFGLDTSTKEGYNKDRGYRTGLGFNLFSLIAVIPGVGPIISVAAELAKAGGVDTSLGLSVGSGNSWGYSEAQSSGKSIGVSEGYDINYRSREIVVYAMVKDCAIIEAKGTKRAPKKFENFTGIYCGQPYAKEFKETYYFLSDSAPQDNFQDGSSINDRVWVMMLRGAPYWNLFRGFMENKQINLKTVSKLTMRRDEGVVPKDVFDAIDAHKVSEIKNMRTTQVAPGMVMDMSAITDVTKRADENMRIKKQIDRLQEEREERIKLEDTIIYE